jgi:ERCC4-related helicase
VVESNILFLAPTQPVIKKHRKKAALLLDA